MAPDDASRRRLHPTAHTPRRGGPGLRVLVADGQGRRVRAGALASWLGRVAPPGTRGTVSVALVSSARIRALNRTYRRQDCATDVLSFAAIDSRERMKPGDFLGDIVIARPVAERQARAAGHSETTELRVLALHGLLHLLGYDHERDSGTMRRIELRLRRKGGLREGVIERGTRSPGAVKRAGQGRPRGSRAGDSGRRATRS